MEINFIRQYNTRTHIGKCSRYQNNNNFIMWLTGSVQKGPKIDYFRKLNINISQNGINPAIHRN